MKHYVIAVDQSTSATKAILFGENGEVLRNSSVPHKQYYPKEGWVEHDADEIYANTVAAIREVVGSPEPDCEYSLALTNQRETVVVWDKQTGKPICHAIVWQDMRGKDICDSLEAQGYAELVRERSGLRIDPYFSGSCIKWILDNVAAPQGINPETELLAGTIDSWLIWKLSGGAVHATDYTNASRTMLFNIHSLDWDDDLLRMLGVPRAMMPKALPCDSVFCTSDVEGLFGAPVEIAGVLGDSHGALAGQMCFNEGDGKVTYGTGSSVMVNIGEKAAPAPEGLVTSVGFAANGKLFYAFEGNIHCSGAIIAWLKDNLGIIADSTEAEPLARSVKDSGGVYLVPAFAGLGAPYWAASARACIGGLSLASTRAHVCRAGLESIAFQIKDLLDAMLCGTGVALREVRVDGGPTKNSFLMQLQSDLLGVPVVQSEVLDASAFGAFIMNGFARKKWKSFDEAAAIWAPNGKYLPSTGAAEAEKVFAGWKEKVSETVKQATRNI